MLPGKLEIQDISVTSQQRDGSDIVEALVPKLLFSLISDRWKKKQPQGADLYKDRNFILYYMHCQLVDQARSVKKTRL